MEVACSPAPCSVEGKALGITAYSYDGQDRLETALYRMTEERVTDPRGNRATTYTFDATGNRLSRTVSCDPACNGEITAGTTTYSYDKNDRLLSEIGPDGTTSYTYDDNGNTLEKQGPDGITVYTYDANDRLIKATGALESTATETRYVYDHSGVRQGQWVDGQVTRFLVDPNRDYAQVIEELDGSGAAEALYVFGHERISQDRNGSHSTYHADGLGSIRALTRLAGTVTDRYDYNAYGQLEHSEGTTQNDFRYTGEQYDPNLGFYYLRARYYNPANGRFPTMDTYQGRIHEPQTLHKYLYVHGDPVNMVDPSGNVGIFGMLNSVVSYVSRGVRVGVGVVARHRNRIGDALFQARSLNVIRRSIAFGQHTDGFGFGAFPKNVVRPGTYEDALAELRYIASGLRILGVRVRRNNVSIDYRRGGSRIRRSASVRQHGKTVANAHLQINNVGRRSRQYKIRFI